MTNLGMTIQFLVHLQNYQLEEHKLRLNYLFDLIEGKGISGRQVRDISALVTIFSGIPITPLGKSGGYLIDVGAGKVNPENAMDLIRGTLTGKASKASRGL